MTDSPLTRLRDIVARLRAPDGCPWDREQTHASLRTSLLEECYETLAAIDAGDDPNLREELGDLLLHVVLHSQIAQERDAFDLDAVAEGACEKMIRRHPHVFGGDALADSATVLKQWEQIKREEKGSAPDVSRLAGLLDSLPALVRAQKAQEKAARAGFDWSDAEDVFAKLQEEIAELNEAHAEQVAEELGDVLFTAVNVARWKKLDAEMLLQRATDKFIRRFQGVEDRLREAGKRMEDTPPAELDALWNEAKRTP